MDISGHAAIVTGGGSGMGKATAGWLAQAGAKVCALDINADAIAATASEFDILGVDCDVCDPTSVSSALTKAADAHGVARIVVNCAGIATASRIVGKQGPMSLDAFRRVIEVNLIGTFNVMRLAATAIMALEPVVESDERGVIVNTASVAAYEGQIGQAAYSASKGAIVSLTLQSAREFARHGIRVMSIAPGLIATPMLTAMPQAVQESLAAQVPFPNRLGRPEEYAQLVAHIVNNEMLNGDVIRLDGAIRMQPR